MKSGIILFDWITFSTKELSATEVIEFLGMEIDGFAIRKGFYNYSDRYFYDGVSVHFDDEREEVCCEMSGQGCRTFESFGHGAWDSLLEWISEKGNLTRLDIAFDDHEGLLDLEVIATATHMGHYVSRVQDHEVIYTKRKGITVYLGSQKSERYLRFYDKAKERNREEEGHWVRMEMQLRDVHARSFAQFLTKMTMGEALAGVVAGFVRFADPSGDGNKCRWKTSAWWSDFIGTVEPLSTYENPGTEYNYFSLERYGIHQAGATIAALCEIIGEEQLLDEVRKQLARSKNPKYQEVIDRCKSELVWNWGITDQ